MADQDKELKDQRVVTMMKPSELEAIDDWMFNNRIRSRGEAIRRLCQFGLVLDENIVVTLGYASEASQSAFELNRLVSKILKGEREPDPEFFQEALALRPIVLGKTLRAFERLLELVAAVGRMKDAEAEKGEQELSRLREAVKAIDEKHAKELAEDLAKLPQKTDAPVETFDEDTPGK